MHNDRPMSDAVRPSASASARKARSSSGVKWTVICPSRFSRCMGSPKKKPETRTVRARSRLETRQTRRVDLLAARTIVMRLPRHHPTPVSVSSPGLDTSRGARRTGEWPIRFPDIGGSPRPPGRGRPYARPPAPVVETPRPPGRFRPGTFGDPDSGNIQLTCPRPQDTTICSNSANPATAVCSYAEQ